MEEDWNLIFEERKTTIFFLCQSKSLFISPRTALNLTMLIYKSHWWVFITNVSRSCLTLEASSFFCGFNVNFEFSHDSELFSMLNFWVFWRVVFKQRPTRYRLQARIKCYFSYLCLLFIVVKHCQSTFVFFVETDLIIWWRRRRKNWGDKVLSSLPGWKKSVSPSKDPSLTFK